MKLKNSLEKQRKLEAEILRMKEDAERECDQCVMRAEVQTDQEAAIKEKDKEIQQANNKFKKIQKDLEANKDQHKTSMDNLYDTLGNLTKRNNDRKAEISKQKELIETREKDNSHITVTTAQVINQEPMQSVDMSKESTERRCQACDKIFKAESDLERHIRDKHTKSECPMCSEKFSSAKQANDHICMEGDIVPQICDKAYCKKEFVSTATLAKHMKSSHFGSQRSVCQKCGEIVNTNEGINKHKEKCNRANAEQEPAREKSKVV